MSEQGGWKLAGLRDRARRRWPVWLLSAFIAALIGMLMMAEPLTPMQVRLPDLQMRHPGGERLETAELVGRPWLINVWLPG